MKKLTSILCALMVMLSVNATPVLTGFQKMSKDDFAKQQVLKTNMDKKAPVAKMTLEAQLAKHAPAALTIRKAPAAKMDTYNVTIATYKATFWEAEVVGDPDDVQYIMDDADGDFRFAFDIYVAAGDEDVVLGQTYTLSDMIADYTWGGCPNTEEEFADFTAVTFVKTMTDGLVNITVNVTDEDGNIYNIVYQEEPLPVATDTIEVVYDAADVTLTDATKTRGIFQFIGKNAAYWSYVCVKSKTIEGTYTNDDMYLDYTALYDLANDTTEIDALAGDAVVTRSNDTLYLSAYLLGEDAHCYHVMMPYYDEPFVPTGDTVVVNIANPMTYKYYSSQGDWWLQAENANYKVRIDVMNHDPQSPAGVYNMDSVLANYTDITIKADTTKLTTMDLKAVVTADSVRIDLVADMLMSDGNVYHVTMFYKNPEVLYYDTIVATNLEFEEVTFMGFVLGYSAIASNENYEVSISLDDTADGVYEAAGAITNLLTDEASDIFSGDVTIATVDGNKVLTGSVLCMNETLYTLNLTFVMPEPEREETITANGTLKAWEEDMVWQAVAVNANADREVVLTMNYTNIAGTYTLSNIYGGKYYSYVQCVAGTDTTYYLPLGLECNVAVANDVATVTGNMITKLYEGEEVVKFNFTLTCAVTVIEPSTGMDYDAEDEDFVENFPNFNIVIEEDYQGQHYNYIELYGVVYVEASNANDATVTIEFNVGEDAEGLTLGTYTINNTEAVGTVTASPGVQNNSVYPSYAAYVNDEGYLTTPLWFMEEGTVTVSDGSIVVNAKNSYGRTISCKLGNAAGINEIENTNNVKVEKIMRNGQLIIRANGVEYNAQGAVL